MGCSGGDVHVTRRVVDDGRDRVRLLRVRLREEEASVEKRQLRRDDDVARANRAGRRLDDARIVAPNVRGSGELEDVSTPAGDRLGERGDVFPRMELRLVVNSESGDDRKRQSGLGRQHRFDPGRAGGGRLALQLLDLLLRLGVDVVTRALEVAVDAALRHERGDQLERLLVRSGVGTRRAEAERALELGVDQTVPDGQLRRGVTGRTVSNRAALEERDGHAGLHEQVRSCGAGDAGAENRDVDVELAFQLRVARLRVLEPVRPVEPRGSHAPSRARGRTSLRASVMGGAGFEPTASWV